MQLCDHQVQYVDRIIQCALNSSIHLPSLLFVGPPGSGKRTISLHASQKIGVEFVEVSLNQAKEAVTDQLCGSVLAAERALNEGVPPGLLGKSSPMVLYLSELQNVDLSLVDALYKMLKTRTYSDRLGTIWKLNADLWLIGSLTVPARNATVGYDHKICGAFQQTVLVSPPSSAADFLSVCKSISAEHPSPRNIATDIGDFLAVHSATPENLHAVRRWLSIALDLTDVGALITSDILRRAIEADLQWVFLKLVYRGRVLPRERFNRWLAQFPSPHPPVAMHLVRQIANSYYIGDAAYYDALSDLIKDSGIQSSARVVFCKWQHTGASAPAVAHDLKNQAHWKVLGEIDLNQPTDSWPTFSPSEPDWFILADDFVGSGGTLAKLFSQKNGALSELLDKYKATRVRILAVAGFESGLRTAQGAIPRPHRDRVSILAARLFHDEDTCFHPMSKILPNGKQRELFRSLCLDLGSKYFSSMSSEMRLGYKNLGAIVVFFNTIPNNSLPILWHTTGDWYPLFPASGLLSE